MSFILLLSLLWPSLVSGDHFSEELLLSPLQSGELHAHFKFTTVHPGDPRNSQDWKHYRLLARPLGEVLATYMVQELSLSLTQGLWRASASGYPVESAPPGAAVSARFLPEVPAENVDTAWEGLTNALAGLLCASLNKLDKTTGVSPKHSFQPTGAQGANLSTSPSHLRYGLLPKENLCTENLTPWKKLLPCKGRRGLSTLLNSGSIQKHSSYQALLLKVLSHISKLNVQPCFLSMICDGVYFYLPGATCLFLFHLHLPGNRGIQPWRKLNLLGNHDCHSVFRSLSQYRSCSIQQCTMASPRTPTGTLSICLALVLLVLALWLTTARLFCD